MAPRRITFLIAWGIAITAAHLLAVHLVDAAISWRFPDRTIGTAHPLMAPYILFPAFIVAALASGCLMELESSVTQVFLAVTCLGIGMAIHATTRFSTVDCIAMIGFVLAGLGGILSAATRRWPDWKRWLAGVALMVTVWLTLVFIRLGKPPQQYREQALLAKWLYIGPMAVIMLAPMPPRRRARGVERDGQEGDLGDAQAPTNPT